MGVKSGLVGSGEGEDGRVVGRLGRADTDRWLVDWEDGWLIENRLVDWLENVEMVGWRTGG